MTVTFSEVYYEYISWQVSAKDSKLTETVKRTNSSKVTLKVILYNSKRKPFQCEGVVFNVRVRFDSSSRHSKDRLMSS